MRYALRILVKACREHDLEVRLLDIPSNNKVIADALSRGDIGEAKNQVQKYGWIFEKTHSPLMKSREDGLVALIGKHRVLDYFDDDH